MPLSRPPLNQHLAALRAAAVVVPPKPLVPFPPAVIDGGPPTPEEVAADAAYQIAIDAWVVQVEQLYFKHFGIAER